MAKNTRTFSDLDLNFNPHPVTGDISLRYDDNAIKTSVKHLILTSFYERLFHPEIGSPVKSLLFEPAGPMLGPMIEKAIRQTIENHEPRVVLNNVSALISPDTNTVYATIEFTIVNTYTPIKIDLILERTR